MPWHGKGAGYPRTAARHPQRTRPASHNYWQMNALRPLTAEELAALTYTVAELRQLAREHQVRVPRGALHHELARALTAAGVPLPRKRRKA